MGKQIKAKEPIRLRTKNLANGNQSLYLDIYIDGARKYEFLKLYLIPEKNKEAKKKNEATLQLANAIKAKKIVELQNNEHGFSNHSLKLKIKLCDYIQHIIDNSDTKHRKQSLSSLLHHLNKYNPTDITFKQLDKDYISGFIKYLKTAEQEHSQEIKKLHQNTQIFYCKLLSFCFNYAISDDILQANPMDRIKKEDLPKAKSSERVFLTLEELKLLIETDLYNKTLKQAFLFSCFCGLRHSDIKSLEWKNILKAEDNTFYIKLTQQKTKEDINLPLSEEAIRWLPKVAKKDKKGLVFKDLISLGRTNEVLPKWANNAGINKHVTYHVSRHTHATLLLTLGADLYTVSKLLGHNNITTTQIYAKIVDQSKRKAVNLIPNISSKEKNK